MQIQAIIDLALKEDLGKLKDITSRAIFTENDRSKAKIIAKEIGIIAGSHLIRQIFNSIDSEVKIDLLVKDGDAVKPGQEIVIIEGKTISILEGERVVLNFLGHLSGVASKVKQFVNQLEGLNTKILDTRKTLPGLRELEKMAVKAGGGVNHRMGLYDEILIKENHIKAAGSISLAVDKVREAYNTNFVIVVESQNLDEVKEALAKKVSRILLDNMTLEMMSEAVKLVDKKLPLEASGNVTLERVKNIAETGVDFISVGSITHSVSALDLSLLII